MTDLVLQYLIQFATITAAAMALAEWLTIPVGTIGKNRKRLNALFYAIGLGGLGYVGDLVVMPADGFGAAAGIIVLATASVATAHLVVTAKDKYVESKT